MSGLLDQNEIDLLLSAVEDTAVEDVRQPTKIFGGTGRRLHVGEVRDYDFKRPERISKDQMRALQTLHEAFARNFGAGLSGMLRTIVEVRLSACEQMTYSEFIAGLPNPTSFNLIAPAGLEGNMCLELSPLIVYPIIDRLLGGTNEELFVPQRPLTVIEQRLISKLIGLALESLSEAWAGVRALEFKLGEMESNPQLVQIVPPNEVVVVIGFEVKMANRAGTMNLCIPYNVIEPVMEALAAQSWFSTARLGKDPAIAATIADRLGNAEVEITATLAETTMTMAELRSLAVGDLILTEKSAHLPAVLCVEGEKKLLVAIGQHRNKRAMRVIRPIHRTDRV
jgi:flagellar motor switch protein FliM